jgi:prepilin peptidase CpaA
MANLTLAHGIGVFLAILACVCDLRTRRIPQVLTLGGAVAGLLFHLITGGWSAGGASLVGWAIGIVIFLAPFALGGLGGGDVKLLGALGAWFGPTEAVWVALYAGSVGLVLAVVYSLSTGYLKTAVTNVIVLLTFWRFNGVRPLPELTLAYGTGPRLAYALPILGGTLMTVWLR